ncbi:hypothetical protein WJX81_005453 [Elliptochloris bilobata]|uniref:Orn/DAP/Arg decarboxylase 2 N-terminal domain-containing protein n=1 Tax=Elliptochloris bilobata TaxID=381761 RepID=A0AAW1QKD7_9CHLO
MALPCPGFEGSEKRLEVDFCFGPGTPPCGLRTLSRPQLDGLLEKASCCIVSRTSNAHFDAYVLSESSLFVFPDRLVLKTCGTTKLLDAVPELLGLAAALDLQARRCKYSRASFLFPEHQPMPHGDFSAEVQQLRASLGGNLGALGSAYVLGDALNGLQWHVFVADVGPRAGLPALAPVYTLEICMTHLCPTKAANFVRGPDFVSAAATTAASGIGALLLGAAVDDYVFEPCGYSMNAVDGAAFTTIHVTPEEGFSYASVELCGYAGATLDASTVVEQVAAIFNPERISVALSVDQSLPCCPWAAGVLAFPSAYTAAGAACQAFAHGGRTSFYSAALGGVTNPIPFPGPYAADGSSQRGAGRRLRGALARSVADVLALYDAAPLARGDAGALDAHIKCLVAAHGLEDPVYVVDLGMVARLWAAWTAAMPRVAPFYAVKCNDDEALLALLAVLGAGFDCASEAEVDRVLALGLPPGRIVYANACKRPRDIRHAAARGVDLTTFDTPSELAKLAAWHPRTRALLRLRADDLAARCQLGNKYGAEPKDVSMLLRVAAELGIEVAGVSFHVGSGATNPAAFSAAIALAADAFAAGAAAGHTGMDLLDIGGGFCGGTFDASGRVDLGGVPAAVNAALAEHFPPGCGVRVIAEPGRYFAEAAATLACLVYGVRDGRAPGGGPARDYWITDGLYGSMNCLLYDHAVLACRPLGRGAKSGAGAQLLPSTVFGPTCDGLDTVLRDHPLPRMENGDWLVFPKMGAYTHTGASAFNGFDATSPHVFYVFSQA